jgi:hypothetical protein
MPLKVYPPAFVQFLDYTLYISIFDVFAGFIKTSNIYVKLIQVWSKYNGMDGSTEVGLIECLSGMTGNCPARSERRGQQQCWLLTSIQCIAISVKIICLSLNYIELDLFFA